MPTLSPNPDCDWLIAQAQRFESLATSSQTFDNDDFIEFFNASLQSELIPIIQSVNEEFGVMYIDYPVSSLADTKSIRIPGQATGARLRNVQYITDQGFITNFARLNPDKLGESAAYARGFYIQNNNLVFYPGPPTGFVTGTLRLSFFQRPNTLCATLNTGRVIAIDTVGNTVTLDNSPTGLDWVDGVTVDVIIGTSPYDFRAQSVTVNQRSGAVLQLDADIIAELEIGDYFALAGYSPVPQFVPAEGMQLLAQMGAARCLQSLGDTEGWKISASKIAQLTAHFTNLISDRVEAQPKRLSAVGLARRSSWYAWY